MNVSLKNLETQVGQLTLVMQSRSKDAFPSDTRKNPNVWWLLYEVEER